MKEEEERKHLDNWHESMTENRYEEADVLKKELEEHLQHFAKLEHRQFYKLLLTRYALLHNDVEKATEIFSEIKPDKEQPYHWLNYYYYFFGGILHYESRAYKKAIASYSGALRFLSQITIEESAELYYKLASAYNRNYQVTRSIKYTTKALEIFKQKENLKRVASCENLLGINNKDIDQYKEAKYHFDQAILYLEKAQDLTLKMRILHNLGVLYSKLNNPQEALGYLDEVKDSIPVREGYLACQNFYFLSLNYFETGQPAKALETLDKGLSLTKEHHFENFYEHFALLKAKFAEPNQFEQVYKKGIDYFQKHERFEYVIQYCEELATHLRHNNKLEDALHYFELAVAANQIMKKERFEDEKIPL